MEKCIGVQIGEEVSNISSCLYGTLNVVRPLIEAWMTKEGTKVIIDTYDYIQEVKLISTGNDDNWKRVDRDHHEFQYNVSMARYLYRDFIFKLLNSCKLNKHLSVTFMVDGSEVGSFSRNKIMGVYYNRVHCVKPTPWYAQQQSPCDMEFKEEVQKQIVADVRIKDYETVVELVPEWFFSGQLDPENERIMLTPYLMYLACKAGDALITAWLDMLIQLRCEYGTSLTIQKGTHDTSYYFSYQRVCNDWEVKTTNVNHYELYPKMQFLESGLC